MGEETPNAEIPAQPEWAENQTQLAGILGLKGQHARKTVQRWLKQDGNPGCTPDGRYHVASWIEWADKNGRKKPSGKADKVALETEALQLKNRKLRAEVEETEGRLMDVEEVVRVITNMFNSASNRLTGSRHALAPSVVGVSVPEATKRIGISHTEVLADLSVIPEWAKKKAPPQGRFWSNVFARLSGLLQTADPGGGLKSMS